jgi:hypothetical protein
VGLSVGARGSSNSPTRNIRFPTGGLNLSNSKIIVLLYEFLGSEIVLKLLSVTVHSPALQNMVITKHNSSQYIAFP